MTAIELIRTLWNVPGDSEVEFKVTEFVPDWREPVSCCHERADGNPSTFAMPSTKKVSNVAIQEGKIVLS